VQDEIDLLVKCIITWIRSLPAHTRVYMCDRAIRALISTGIRMGSSDQRFFQPARKRRSTPLCESHVSECQIGGPPSSPRMWSLLEDAGYAERKGFFPTFDSHVLETFAFWGPTARHMN
jgi:hypothetical protein